MQQQYILSVSKIAQLLFLCLLIYGVAEFCLIHFLKKVAKLKEYRTTTFGLLFAMGVSVLVAFLFSRLSTIIIGVWASRFALFQTDLSWYWWLYGLFVYEFFYFIQHFLAHKIRLLWCLHSPHHAPESMNMFVGFNHSFLESVFYMPFFLGFFPALLGVNPVIIAVFYAVDAIWGSMIHISDHVLKGRLGWLEHFMQTPSYHRVHHAQNIRYMDTNYTSITLFWDWVFGTLQPLRSEEPIQYGITRTVDTQSFVDVHFGEVILLYNDVAHAPTLADKLKYLIMPPGWTHEGEPKTASYLKKQLLA